MWDFFKHGNWEPGMVIVLVMVIGILVMMITAIVAASWSRVRREEIQANLKRDMIDRGIPIEQVERLVNSRSENNPPADEKKLEANLASLLVQHECPAPTLERVIRIYQDTDSATKKTIFAALEEIVESQPDEEQLLAAIRALCPARATPLPSNHFQEVPAAV